MRNPIYIFQILLMMVFAAACNEADEPQNLQTEQEQDHNIKTETSIHLTAEQIAMAGIEFGMAEERQISEYIECKGLVALPPNNLASVYSAVNGFVGNVKYLPGSFVKKGSLLTTIKHPDIIKLQTSFLESKSRLEFAKTEYERKQTLATEDATSEKLLQEAKLNYETESAHFQGLKAELNLIGLPTAEIEAGNIQPHVQIFAPISGYIASVKINKGKLITPEDLLYEIVNDNHLHLELQVFSKDIQNIKKDQLIEAYVPGVDEKILAEVHLVGHVIDLETKTTIVHGHFKNKPPALTAGTYLHARIYNKENKTLAIPQTALIRSGEDTFVYILSNGNFIRKDVVTGASDDDYIAVEKLELLEGEKLVTKGAYYIHGSDGEQEADPSD